jgi:hypothetical protein
MAPFLDKAPTSRHSGVRERSRVHTLLCNEAPECQKRLRNTRFFDDHFLCPVAKVLILFDILSHDVT